MSADIRTTLAERRKTHGDFSANAEISQKLKDVCRQTAGWGRLSYAQKEALDYHFGKIGRILSGNPDEPDHWRDIAGYSTLAYEETRTPEPQ